MQNLIMGKRGVVDYRWLSGEELKEFVDTAIKMDIGVVAMKCCYADFPSAVVITVVSGDYYCCIYNAKSKNFSRSIGENRFDKVLELFAGIHSPRDLYKEFVNRYNSRGFDKLVLEDETPEEFSGFH